MSDHQNPATELTGTSEGPDAKKPCLIDTPPVAGTPDNASDFYNTPLTGGTPALTESAQVAEASSASLPHPSIPGLNLVDHPTEQDTIMETEPTIKQEGQDLAANQEGSQNPPQPQVSDAAIKEEAETTQVKREQNALVDDVMEIVETQDGNMIDADVKNENEDEHPEWEVDSSPYESSSDSSDSSDSDDSDDEDYPIMSAEEQAKILMHAEGGSDDEGDGKGKSGANLRTTNEIEHEVLPLPDVQITPEMKIVFLGKIHAAIDNNVLIEANTSGEYQVLESGSLLCSDDRKIIGVVAETLGRVENPLYTMTYKTAAEVEEKGLVKGIDIFYVVDHSTFVFTQPLKGLKGSDASNFHDEEVAAEEMEFSDDEEEAEYKRKLKQKRQERKEARDGPKGKKAAPGPSKLNQTELNYDDAGAEGYTPLERPTNLHEMMGAREAPIEGNERGGHRGRGRGRGDRGRGGRGRGGAGRGGRDWDHERRPHQSHEPQNQTQPQHQQQPPQPQPAPYGQPAYGMPQPFAAYAAQYGQQQAQNPQFAQQQPQFGQGGPQPQYPFQFPFQQPQMQPGGFQGAPQGAPHINPLFLAALQQQQQYQQQPQQYQQYQPQYQQPQQHQPQQQQQQQQQPPQGQAPPMGFDQVKAQLDLLRSLSQGNQGPPPS